jgi:tetratricopeptide (TPR) repeat protein
MVGSDYASLGSYDQAVASYRKAASLSSFYSGIANYWMGQALSKKKDWDGAITALREAILLLPERRAEMYLPAAYYDLGVALSGAGRHAEALKETLAALRENPAWAVDPRNGLRYNAAAFAVSCADGKGANAPPPAERPAYRKQAFDLLTAELATLRKLAAADPAFVRLRTQHWLVDEDLASVRDPKAVEQLPPDVREAWRKLWAGVRDHTAPPSSPPQPVP